MTFSALTKPSTNNPTVWHINGRIILALKNPFSGASTTYAIHSSTDDGATWTAWGGTAPASTGTTITGIWYCGGRWYIVFSDSTLRTSTDFSAWTSVNLPTGITTVSSIVYIGSQWVISEEYGASVGFVRYCTTSDGTTLSAYSVRGSGGTNDRVYNISVAPDGLAYGVLETSGGANYVIKSSSTAVGGWSATLLSVAGDGTVVRFFSDGTEFYAYDPDLAKVYKLSAGAISTVSTANPTEAITYGLTASSADFYLHDGQPGLWCWEYDGSPVKSLFSMVLTGVDIWALTAQIDEALPDVTNDYWRTATGYSDSSGSAVFVSQEYSTYPTAGERKLYLYVPDVGISVVITESAAAADTNAGIVSFYAAVRDGIEATTSATLQAAYLQALSETALGQVVVSAGKHFDALIAEAVTGNVSAALALSAQLVELSAASDVPISRAQLIVDLAEVVVALTSLANGTTYDFLETAAANDTVAPRVAALALLIESMLAADTPAAALTLISVVEEGGTADDTPAALLSAVALLTEAANAGVLLRLGDDYYVGWAMNPEGVATKNGMAPTVSQYQNYPFNSFAKLGGRYYAAGAAGIYELTGSDDAGTPIVGYLKSGKLDFGSSMQKRMDSAYFAVATDGTVRLKVITNDNGENVETWYQVASSDAGAVAENIRLKIGKGLRSRYWQFELVVEDASNFEMDELTLVPLNMTRRL